MTDVTPPSGPPGPGELSGAGDELSPEELASGYLDGELEADDRARVEADPALMERVAELQAVRDAVAAPVPALTDDQRTAMVATAMAALPPSGAAGVAGTAAAVGSVASLEAARARRSARLVRAVAGGLAAAAAVGLVALVVTRGGNSNDNTARDSAATEELEASAGGGPQATEASTSEAAADAATADTVAAAAEAPAAQAPATNAPGEAGGGTTTAPAMTTASAGTDRAVPDLGALADRSEARSATSEFAAVPGPSDGTGPCAGYPPPVATATFQGIPAYVVIIEVAPEGNRLAFIDQVTCAVLVKVDPASL